MKKKLLIFVMSFGIVSSFSQFDVWANPSSASQSLSGNYSLKYRYEFINSATQPVDKITVKGLLLLKDSSGYYTLVDQNIDGEIEKRKGMYYFTKEINDIKPKTVSQIVDEYIIQLNPIVNQIDFNQVQPLKNKENFSAYLNPEPYIEPNNALIKETAQQLVGNESNPYIKAKTLYKFVATKMKYNLDSPIKNTGSVNAMEDIMKAEINQQQGGVCYDYATLYVALLRSQGIPARVISGFKISSFDLEDLESYDQINIIYNLHSWVEFYLEPYGWVFADPTVDSISDDSDIFQNFIGTNNLYIKKGYNLPSDILEYSIESESKSQIKVRQSAVLKKNAIKESIGENNQYTQNGNQGNELKEDSKEESGSNSVNHQDQDKTAIENNTKSNKYVNININNIIEYRKENAYKVSEYQKAKKESKKIESVTQPKAENQTTKKENIQNTNDDTGLSLQTEDEGKPNLFQRIISFFIKIFNKLFKR